MVKKLLPSCLSKQPRTTLPSLKDLELVRGRIGEVGNRRGEFLRKVHYGCFLLCSEAGLRISEAVRFDLKAKTRKGLYRIEKPKGKKERLVYVPKKVEKELKKNDWKPNQSNRFNFYHFLRKIKQKVNINQNVELTPHNLRRAFATYHAENGLPLPLLSKLLGHSSIRTTALYWQNIYGEDEVEDILVGKKWLENGLLAFDKEKKPKLPPPEISEPVIKRNLAEPLLKPDYDITKDKPLNTTEKPNNKSNLLLTDESDNYQPQKLINKISSENHREFSLNTSEKTEISKSLSVIANEKWKTYSELSQKEQSTEKEQILLTRIKELEEKLTSAEQQLKRVQEENERLNIKKEKADNYQQQLKTISKFVYQWQKINYFRRLEREAKVEQLSPPNFKK